MNQIVEKSKKLFEIEKQFLQFLVSKADKNVDEIISLIGEAISIEEEIKLLLAENDPTNLVIKNEDIQNTIKAVSDGKGLKCIEAYSVLIEQINSSSSNEGKSKLDTLDFITNNWDDLFDTFHAQFDLNSYFQRKLLLGPLITDSSIPPDLENFFFELKEAYAYGLNKTCIALCRMVVENSFSDVLLKNQIYCDTLKLTKSAKKKPNFEFSLFENINLAESLNLISNQITANAHEVRTTGNKVIHSDRVENIDTIKMIKKSINIVESLYRKI